MATSAPGYTSIRPKTLRTAGRDAQAERLRDRPVRQVPRGAGVGRPAQWGRSIAWPTGSGFEYFYGFIGGETNQYYPGIYEGTNTGRATEDA